MRRRTDPDAAIWPDSWWQDDGLPEDDFWFGDEDGPSDLLFGDPDDGRGGWTIPRPERAAIPTHPLCAASLVTGRRHRVGPEPLELRYGDRVWSCCSWRCVRVWVRRAVIVRPARIRSAP